MEVIRKLKSPMGVNFISLATLQGINYLLPLLSFPFLFRVLGVEKWGLVTFGYALMQYFIIFTDFGFNLSATKYISEHKADRQGVNAYLNSALSGRFLLCGISFLILLTLITCLDRFEADSHFYLLYFGLVLGNVMFPMWFFQGMENMKYITIFHVIAKSLSFMPLFIFIREPGDYIYVPACYSSGYILGGLVSLWIVYKKMGMRWYFTSPQEIWGTLRDSSTYFLSTASTALFTTSNTLVLGLVCGNTVVGYYSAAEKLYYAYNQLLSPVTGVLFPHIAKSHDTRFFQKLFYRIVAANLFCVALALLLAPYILQVVYGTADPHILRVFTILQCVCLVTIPSILLGYPFLAAMGHPLYTNMTTVITSMVHIAGLIILYLTGVMDETSVALLVVLTESLLISFRLYGVRKFRLFGPTNKNHPTTSIQP